MNPSLLCLVDEKEGGKNTKDGFDISEQNKYLFLRVATSVIDHDVFFFSLLYISF